MRLYIYSEIFFEKLFIHNIVYILIQLKKKCMHLRFYIFCSFKKFNLFNNLNKFKILLKNIKSIKPI